ncbi:hypothetical protein OVA03_04615 [Asticcacaulis sp. SL142]|uniref:hypothetical protein n=1 Tax=Asticcacaulis sp. SL142 TaxID=2995155 RepID=UPI00226CFA29|nr:hypothetical protein [Asticcacaulis sp. SL142]WAC49201.1 hypothetical protein OVA03_04615 [Asticcacaulis sp. SL142]
MDALVRKLNELGYQPVFLPQTNIVPPELYTYSRKLRRLVRRGPLLDYFPEQTKFEMKEGKLADIAYQYTSAKGVKATTSFLENSLRCIGIEALPKLDLGFAGSNSFSFAFTDVSYRRVEVSQIDKLIQALQLGAIPQSVVNEGGIHIAYEYAYANELLMRRSDGMAFSSDVSGKVGTFIDIGTKGSVSLTSETTISFKGEPGQRAAFAYKAGFLSKEDEDSVWEFHPEETNRDEGGAQEYVPERGVVLGVSVDE